MKNIFVRISAIATIGLVMASCNNEEANTKALESDNAAVQALVDAKVATLDEEVTAACEEKATAAAQLVVDSLVKIKPAVAKAVATKAKSKPAAKPTTATPVKEEPKKGFGGAVQTPKEEGSKGFGGAVKEENTAQPKKKGFGGQVNP